MLRKFKYMVKGLLNPFASLMAEAIGWSSDRTKDSYLVRCKYCSLTEFDDYINRANAAWEGITERYFISNKPIQFEISTVTQEFGKWNPAPSVLPYIQLKLGNVTYRLTIPKRCEGLEGLNKRFGDFYINEDVRDVIKAWLDKDHTVSLEKDGNVVCVETVMEDEEEETMLIQQETDLFVVSEGKVWSVDSGECVYEMEVWYTKDAYVFAYKRYDYHRSRLQFIFSFGAEMVVKEVLVVEYLQDEYELDNVENVEYCLVECIRTGWLKKLEKMYRDGRSNLPDAVFDHIMEVRGMNEERLQKLCYGTIKDNKHYNSSGVQSSKAVASVPVNVEYPAFSKILSQDKVRDTKKLESIVHSWGGKAVVSWKLDGAAVRLHYKGTQFVRAESKGKARDVTELMRWVDGVPRAIHHGFPFVEDWFKDKEWFVTGELVTKNGRRSVAAGYLLRKDADSDETVAIGGRLHFVVYDSNICEYQTKDPMVAPIRLYSQMMNLLGTEAGFHTVDLCEFKCAEQIDEGNITEDLPIPQDFDTDGLVVRLNDIKKYASLGETAHHPKGSVAFKFEDEWKTVNLDCLYGKRGSNGVIKLIAEFRPLKFGDKTVKSAVWQPKDDGKFSLEYNSKLYEKDGGYEVWYTDYSHGGKKRFKDHFNVDKIEVCLRGCVIPQWRLIEQ